MWTSSPFELAVCVLLVDEWVGMWTLLVAVCWGSRCVNQNADFVILCAGSLCVGVIGFVSQ